MRLLKHLPSHTTHSSTYNIHGMYVCMYLIIWWVTSLGHQTDWSNHEVLYFKTNQTLKDQHCHNQFSCCTFIFRKINLAYEKRSYLVISFKNSYGVSLINGRNVSAFCQNCRGTDIYRHRHSRHIHRHIHTQAQTYTYTGKYTYTDIFIHRHRHIHRRIQTQAQKHIQTQAQTHSQTYTQTYAYQAQTYSMHGNYTVD